MKHLFARLSTIATAAVLGAVLAIPATYADDTEIFFGKEGVGAESNPNILFILDTSGSMRARDGMQQSRIERMKSSMNALLDQSSSFNVGLMGFNMWQGGGSIRYPVDYLEEDKSTNCPLEGCPDQRVVGRGISSDDDAYEVLSTGEVTISGDATPLGMINPDNVVNNGNSGTGNQITETVPAVSSIVEANRIADGEAEHQNDPNLNLLFYWGTPGTHDTTQQAFRFDEINIPTGSTVTSASITFTTADSTKQSGELGLYLSAEATSNPGAYPNPTTVEDETLIALRNTTNELVAWPEVPAAIGGAEVETPDIASLLQEVISLPGWTSGNSVSIHLDAFDEVEASLETTRQFHGVTAAPTEVPMLTYTYESIGEVISGITTLKANSHSLEHFDPNTLETSQEGNTAVASLFYKDDNHEPGKLGLMFDNAQIPAGVTITSARLKLTPTMSKEINPIGSPEKWAMDVNMELSAAPLPYGTPTLKERDNTDSFITWGGIPDWSPTLGEIFATPIASPDLSAMMQELVDLPDWDENSAVSLLLNPNSETLHTLHRTFLTSFSMLGSPELEVTWTQDNSDGGSDDQNLISGLRFNFIHVPPGAQVTSAHVRFVSHKADDGPSSFTLAAEKISNSLPFSAEPGNLSTRLLTDARETWEVEPWDLVGGEYESVDVTRLVQEVVDQSDWCGGNALSLLIDGTGFREAVSQDANSITSPRLEITYDPDTAPTTAYCSNKFRALSVIDTADDALQTGDGAVDIAGTSLDVVTATGNNSVGVRYSDVGISQGTLIKGANLQISAALDYAGGDSLKISMESDSNPPSYSSAANDITSRLYQPTVIDWSPLPAMAAGETATSVDITSQLQSLIDDPDWESTNSVALKLEGSGNGSLPLFSFEGQESLSVQLLIYYEGERTTPGTLARETLKAEVESMVAAGATPIVESMYEAALYMRGLPVDYGTRRGRRTNINRYSRVSHAESYTGGRLYRPNGCTSRNLNAWACRKELINDNPVYISPINNRCQESHVVLLSDGQPTSMYAVPQTEALMGQTCSLPQGNSRACGVELAEWMNTTDHAADIPGEQKLTLHTIAFNLTDPLFLEQLAEAGGGGYYSANTAPELLSVFKSIFVNVSKTDTSFVAPAVAVDQFNRLKHRDEIFFSQFKPESTARWEGNLKKYKVQGNEDSSLSIVDSLGNPAINEASGAFEGSTKSFWSTETDGGDVTRGGAASRLSLQNRNVYTYTGTNTDLTAIENEISIYNTSLDIDLFDLPPDTADSITYQNNLINWTAGYDSRDEDGDGDYGEVREHMGDPMHSQPLVLDYNFGTSTKSVVMVGTNEGYLHAIDALTGLEQYAFIPPELLRHMRKFYEDDPQSRRIYGVDGGLSAWVDDTNKNGLIDPGEQALLYIGMRRGGSNYYVMDVSVFDKPKLAYIIEGGKNILANSDNLAQGDYRELAQTWSRITKTRVMDGGDPRDVIIFGGGYDTNQDPLESTTATTDDTEYGADGTRTPDSSGRAIFIADAETGRLLWTTDIDDPDYNEMLYSIPSDLRVIDVNSDGMVDQLYFGDMGGQLWRVDINNRSDTTDGLSARISGGKIAELADDTPEGGRRFYYPPDVALVNVYGKQQFALSIGSGWRAHPLQTMVQDRFYNIRIPDVFSAPVDSFGQIRYETINESSDDLTDVTNDLGEDLSGSKGWYITLEGNGEKALSSSLTLDNRVIFTTYTPAANTEVCAAAVGTGAVYTVDVKNGDPVVDFNDDGSDDPNGDKQLLKSDRSKTLNNPGIAATPAVVFPKEGDATVLIGPETLDEIPINTFKRRTFWQEHIDENS